MEVVIAVGNVEWRTGAPTQTSNSNMKVEVRLSDRARLNDRPRRHLFRWSSPVFSFSYPNNLGCFGDKTVLRVGISDTGVAEREFKPNFLL